MRLTSELRKEFRNQIRSCYQNIEAFISNSNFSYFAVTELYNQYTEICNSLKKIEEYKHIVIINDEKIPKRYLSFFYYSNCNDKDDLLTRVLQYRSSGSYLSQYYENKVLKLFNNALWNLDSIIGLI